MYIRSLFERTTLVLFSLSLEHRRKDAAQDLGERTHLADLERFAGKAAGQRFTLVTAVETDERALDLVVCAHGFGERVDGDAVACEVGVGQRNDKVVVAFLLGNVAARPVDGLQCRVAGHDVRL